MLSFEEILDRFEGVKRSGDNQASARCPAHEDKRASLSLSFDPGTGKILIRCHAGCDTRAVLDAAGLAWKDITPERRNRPGKRSEPEAVYTYQDEHKDTLFQAVRFPGKQFRQRRPARPGDPPDKVRTDPDGSQWVYKLGNTRRVPYRLPEVLEALKAGRRVFIVEGEKDVESAGRLGLDATCNPMGAGKWTEECTLSLQGADAVIIPDNDSAEKGYPGQRHAADILRTLTGTASRVRVLELPPERAGRPIKDLSDWIAAGGPRAELEALADSAPDWETWLAAWRKRLEATPPASASGKKPAPKGKKRRDRIAPAPQRPPEPEEAPNPETLRKRAEEAREAAGELFTAPDVLGCFYRAAVALGLEGEERNAKVLILTLTSRVLDRPINVYLTGESSSGKTYTAERVLDLFPEDACHKFKGASPKALLYTSKDLRHRTLFLNEVDAFATTRRKDGDNAGVALLRNLIEGNELQGETTVTDPITGRFTTQEVYKPGPTGAILTGCHNIDNELMNRCLILSPDESAAQTERVKLNLALRAAGHGPRKPTLTPFHALQRHLQALAPLYVLIPYATPLVLPGRAGPVRDRRDFTALLNLISAHAVLHIGTRERNSEGRIVATLADYEAVYRIAEAVFEAGNSGLTRKQREAVEAVQGLHKAGARGTVRAIMERLNGLSRSSVQSRLNQGKGLGYLRRVDGGKAGEAALWEPGEDLPTALSALPAPEAVARAWNDTPEPLDSAPCIGTPESLSQCGVTSGGATPIGTPVGTPNPLEPCGDAGGGAESEDGGTGKNDHVKHGGAWSGGDVPSNAAPASASPALGILSLAPPQTIPDLARALGDRWPDACEHFRHSWHEHRAGSGTDDGARDLALVDLAQWAGAHGILGVDPEALALGAEHWAEDRILWESGLLPPHAKGNVNS